MVNLLRKLFIKDYQNLNNTVVRANHGRLAAFFGIFSNLLLFIFKILIGIFTFNISAITDSINNLSDMASSIIILIGFHYAKIPADKEHPFGHERIEYIAGLIVSLLIIVSGGVMIYTSINSIINYEIKELNVKITIISLIVLFISVLIKIYQSLFNRKIAKIINSDALKATAQDSLNDSIATSLVFIVLLISLLVQLNNSALSFSLDGILGILISIYIIISGLLVIKDEINHLIGYEDDYKYKDEIIELIKNYNDVIGVHDAICHSYGPTKTYMTIHIEIDANTSITKSHDLADLIEHDIKEKYDIELTIHVDPVDLSDPKLNIIRDILDNEINKEFSYHDLRFIKRYGKPYVEFDLIIPYKYEFNELEFKNNLKTKLKEKGIDYDLSISIDRK